MSEQQNKPFQPPLWTPCPNCGNRLFYSPSGLSVGCNCGGLVDLTAPSEPPKGAKPCPHCGKWHAPGCAAPVVPSQTDHDRADEERLLKERDAALKALDANAEAWGKTTAELNAVKADRDKWKEMAQRWTHATTTRPEPSRLEIATMVIARTYFGGITEMDISSAFDIADALIAEAKKEVARG